MARRSREAVQKRLRERRRAEKAEQKRLKRLARKQGVVDETLEGEAVDGEPGEGGEVVATEEGAPIEEGAPVEEAEPAEPVKTD
jgi:hypothetical protein